MTISMASCNTKIRREPPRSGIERIAYDERGLIKKLEVKAG